MQTMPINIGMAEQERREIASGLSKLLADTYTLYLKDPQLSTGTSPAPCFARCT
jgi:hypothetical protein